MAMDPNTRKTIGNEEIGATLIRATPKMTLTSTAMYIPERLSIADVANIMILPGAKIPHPANAITAMPNTRTIICETSAFS